MFTLMKQFLPPTEEYRFVPMHGPIEGGVFTVDLGEYQPKLLGTSVEEAAYNLLHRVQESTIRARAQVIPIMQALYDQNEDASNLAQQQAGQFDAAVVADAVHTVLSLAQQRFDPEAVISLQQADLSTRIPLEAPNLAIPQSAFFSKPYWGHATRGVALREGKVSVPIRLVTSQNALGDAPLKDAVAVGTRAILTYMVPLGVYDRLEVWPDCTRTWEPAAMSTSKSREATARTLAKTQVLGDQPAHPPYRPSDRPGQHPTHHHRRFDRQYLELCGLGPAPTPQIQEVESSQYASPYTSSCCLPPASVFWLPHPLKNRTRRQAPRLVPRQ